MSTYTAYNGYQNQALPNCMMSGCPHYHYPQYAPHHHCHCHCACGQHSCYSQPMEAAPHPMDSSAYGQRYSHNPYGQMEAMPAPHQAPSSFAQELTPTVRRLVRRTPPAFAMTNKTEQVFDAESVDSDGYWSNEPTRLGDSGATSSANGVSDNESATQASQRSSALMAIPSQRVSDTASTVSSDESQTHACPPVSAPTTPQVQVFRHELKRVLHFVEFPTESLAPLPKFPRELKDDSLSLFFGQVGFNMTPELLCWLIEVITSGRVRPVHAFNCAWSCFVVQFACDEDVRMMLSWRECVIFDRSGIWIAKTQEQKRRLEEYCERVQSGHCQVKGARLPKHAMIIRK